MPVEAEKSARLAFDRRYYGWSAIAVALIAVCGFARTYYLKSFFGTPALTPFLHFHAVVMSAWVALFLVQTQLVATHRIALHRSLGVTGCLLAVLLIAVAADVTLQATQREVANHVVGRFHYLFGINFVNLFAFGCLFCAAILWRKRADFHKRLMLLATVNLLAPAIARIALVFTHNPYAQLAGYMTCILACAILDTVRHRRLNPAMGWGSAFSIVAFALIFVVVQMPGWLGFVDRTLAHKVR